MAPVDRRIAARMTEHITALAAEHGVNVTWVPGGFRRAEAFVESRQIAAPIIRRPSDYFAGLHEIGHIVSAAAQVPETYGHVDYCDVLAEGAAWAWAAAAAIPALARHMTAKDWNLVGYGFRTYVRLAAEEPPDSSQECSTDPV